MYGIVIWDSDAYPSMSLPITKKSIMETFLSII